MGAKMVAEDQHVRDEVLNPAQSFIVQAPAGSGKTELLIRRYLRLLQGVAQPEEIVAITFTRKAASEMRERILKSLKSAEHDPDGKEHQDLRDRERWAIARNVLKRSEELDWRLTTNPARTRIQTIDSFCARLVRQMPMLSRLGGQPDVLEDATALYEEAAEKLLNMLNEIPAHPPANSDDSRWNNAIMILLEHLDNNLLRIRELVAAMLAKRDQWQEHIVGMQALKDSPDADLREVLEQCIEKHIEAALRKARMAVSGRIAERFCKVLNYAFGNQLGDELGHEELKALPSDKSDDLDLWKRIVGVCLTGQGTWRKRLTKNEGFPPVKGVNFQKDEMEDLLVAFQKIEGLLESFQQISNLPEPCYSEQDWLVLEALPELLRTAYGQLRILFKERNQVDFVEISIAAHTALGGEEEPTDLALYLDHRIQHILIDEYQDISKGQYRLLEQLTAGWMDADGHSLFLVGDPMQSIYRFRDAEVGLFLKTWDEQRLGQIEVEPRRITTNFRSDAALVDWANQAFHGVFPPESNSSIGAVEFTPAVAFHAHHEGCGTQAHAVSLDDEPQKVVEVIRSIRESCPEDTIAILVRNRNHLKQIVPMLVKSNTLFRAVEIERLSANPFIQDLLSLVRALHHEADRVAWLAILRAPWCGLSLADLLTLVGEDRAQTVWHCMCDDARVESMSQTGQQRLIRVRGVIQQAFAREGRTSARRWIEGAWINLGGPATLRSEGDLVNAETFFAVLNELDEGGYIRDRKTFLGRIETLFAGADIRSDNTLQVMTIHKAKGLEFDHVILPGLERAGARDREQLLLWSDTANGLLVAPIKRAVLPVPSDIYRFIENYEKKRRVYEEGRLLYVALTRACKSMHLLMACKSDQPRAGTMLANLWHVLQAEYLKQTERGMSGGDDARADENVQNELDEGIEEATNAELRRLSANWHLPEPPCSVAWEPTFLFDRDLDGEHASAIKFKWAGQTIKQVGTIVHRCLQQIATEGAERWDVKRISAWRDYFRDSLRSVGVSKDDIEEASELVRSALIATLDDPRGQWIASGQHEDAKTEFALSGIYQGDLVNIVIDRTFVDQDGIRWIVDYKTSRHESGDVEEFLDLQVDRYREQLEKYGRMMSAYEPRPIRVGLYFPLLRGWREWSIKR